MTKAQTAIAELTEISSQVQAAVLFDSSGAVAAATLPDSAATRLAASARALFESATSLQDAELTQIEAVLGEGSLFVAREGDRLIAAVTGPLPTAGLVFYDLKSCLQRSAVEVKPKRSPRKKASGSS